MKKNKNKSSSEDLMMSRSINKLGYTDEEIKRLDEAKKYHDKEVKKHNKRLDEANKTVNQWILIIIIIGFVLYFLVTLFG